MEKITKRQTLEAILEAAKGETAIFKYDNEVIIAFAENEIALLDKKAVKAKERAAEKRAQGDELSVVVASVLTDELQSIADITAQIEGEDVSVGKVQYRLRMLAETEKAVKGEIKIPATENAKARTIVGYKLAGAVDAE